MKKIKSLMKRHQKAGIIGSLIALGYIVFDIYHAIRISKGFTFTESLLPELGITIITGAILLTPAIILILSEDFKKRNNWIIWLYPIIIGLGLLNVLSVKDPLAAGIPMITFVFPFCIMFTIILLYLKYKPFLKK